MISYLDKIRRGENPFVASRLNILDGGIDRLYELKFGLVLYTNYPPGPKRAREVFDLYVERYGARIRSYMPTVPGSLPKDWTAGTRQFVRDRLLPELRKGIHWGYGFDDGNSFDSYLFMFHGYRPVSEKGKASFFRFEFPWNVDQKEVKQLAIDLIQLVPFESGFGGFFFQVDPSVPEGYNEMYAICRRFWGIEAWNLDVTVAFVLDGYQSVNWLSLIGDSLRTQHPEAVTQAKSAATYFFESPHGVLLQADEQALFGDRNHRESMPGYVAIAQALLPLQLKTFGSFGGERWDEVSSLNWIRRFTHPDAW